MEIKFEDLPRELERWVRKAVPKAANRMVQEWVRKPGTYEAMRQAQAAYVRAQMGPTRAQTAASMLRAGHSLAEVRLKLQGEFPEWLEPLPEYPLGRTPTLPTTAQPLEPPASSTPPGYPPVRWPRNMPRWR